MTSDTQTRLRSLRGKRGALTKRINRGEWNCPANVSWEKFLSKGYFWQYNSVSVKMLRDAFDHEIAQVLKARKR